MNMIRHDQVKAHQPCHSYAPGFHQRIVNRIVGKLGSAFAAADCGENNGRLIPKNKNAFGWMATAWSFTHMKPARQSLALPKTFAPFTTRHALSARVRA